MGKDQLQANNKTSKDQKDKQKQESTEDREKCARRKVQTSCNIPKISEVRLQVWQN